METPTPLAGHMGAQGTSAAPPGSWSPTSVTNAGRALAAQLNQVILGKPDAVDLTVATLLAGGHVLYEDGPGVGKTTLAKALSLSLRTRTSRVQGTPDLLPTDITGLSIYDMSRSTWEYRAGPIFANVVLFDEINCVTPRAQSALFEAMAEGQVTVEGTTRLLPRPFHLLATQNPMNDTSTFALGRAQRDRFMTALSLGLPAPHLERQLAAGVGGVAALATLQPVMTDADLVAAQQATARLHVAPPLIDYIVTLVEAVRAQNPGAGTPSPRATLALVAVSRGLAVLAGRDHARPEDVQRCAPWVLGHRSFADVPVWIAAERIRSIVAAVPVTP